MDPACIDALADFKNFLLAYVHTVLYLRSIYASSTFVNSKLYNAPVYQSRSPDVCSWIMEAITAVHEELSKGTVARIAIVLYHGVVGEVENGTSVKVVERHVLDVGSVPVISGHSETQEIERQQRDPLSPNSIVSVDHWKTFETTPSVLPRLDRIEPLDKDTRPDLAEQFRAVFLRLEGQCAKLSKLCEPRSFMIGMELKDDAKDGPRQDPWITVEPSSGKAGKKAVPIRSVEDKWLCFNVWVEVYENLSKENE
jgi:mitotic spindle assembly checkpoint protein MAD2B